MCGITGIFQPEPTCSFNPDLLRRMNASILHRGPDSEGFFTHGNLGMGIRRLAIIDLASGDQPIFNEDGQIAITYNGEIYNFIELRPELERLGHLFKTQSDTEVVVHAYEQWGDDCLLRFNGMYAFALWDGHRQRLLIARDRMGKKPLYWHFSKQGLLWGSELKALLCAPWVEQRVDRQALHHYLTLQYTPDPLTIYEGIYQVPAGHKLVIEPGGQPSIERWWQLNFEPKWDLSEAEAAEQTRHLLSLAVQRRLITEVPLGAFLSGGIDSSIIVALMAHLSSAPVKTFTIGFNEPMYSEARYARMVAERYQTEHHEFTFRAADLVRVIEGTIKATDEPLADPAILPLYELARQTRQHVTVALCGDGGDETLAGYRRYALDSLLRPYNTLPSWVTRRLVPWTASLFPDPAWIPEDRSPLTGLKRLGQFSGTTEKASLARWGSYFNQADKMALYNADMRAEFSQNVTADWIGRYYDEAQANGLLDRTLFADHATYLAGDLLPKTDRATMAHSLEARSPFLDADWVEWTARLPRRFKVRGLQTKWLLKNAFSDMLPPQIIRRGKQGFSVPVGEWLKNELKGWSQELLLGNAALAEWFDPLVIRRMVDEHTQGRINHGKRLWALLIFAVWHELCNRGK
jgi:asparagine synthase (glutamine-hydrolysing)